MGFLLKLRVLLWKNFLIRRRNKYRLIMEIVYPLILFAILVGLKPQTDPVVVPGCQYSPKAMPSAGRLPFLHSFLCRGSNSCANSTMMAELPTNNRQLKPKPSKGWPRPPSGRPRAPPAWHFPSDPDRAKACEEVAGAILHTAHTDTAAWQVIQPFITGTVLFYPDSDATRAVMSIVNDTFNSLTSFESNSLAGPAENLQALLRSDLGRHFTKAAAAADDSSIFAKMLRNESLTAADATKMDDMADAMTKFGQSFEKCVNRQKVRAVSAETALNDSWALDRNNDLWALVEFENVPAIPGVSDLDPLVKYKIRMNANKIPPSIEKKTPGIDVPSYRSPLTSLMYTSFGFNYLQDMIDTAIIQSLTGRADADRPGRILMQFPDAERVEDTIADMLTQLLPLMMVLAWVYAFSNTVKSVVLEKEERVKEVLAVMGLGRGVQWAGWVAEGLCSVFVTCIILVLIMKFGKLAEHSDVSIVLLLVVSFLVAMLSFAMLVACFFTRATLAGPAAGVIYFLTYLAYQLVQASGDTEPTFAAVLGISLLSNAALAQGTLVLASLEALGEGAQWGNVMLPPSPEQPATMAGSIGMLWLDAALYALLAWYIDAVFPGEYGVPKPFYFFLQKSYWFDSSETENNLVLQGAKVDNPDMAKNVEPEPENAVVGVVMENLSKVFGKKAAVNGLTLNFYQDQINCFLGHNGAGKTTTISMLTGLYTPSAGTARLYGRDIRTDMDAIRASMGVCPQQNIIFNSLTVEEHLLFFGRIKGIKDKLLKAEIDGMLNEMDLEAKRGSMANTLSGGMKRKLSVGMAFVGGSRVVFLDEPTAGVDPFSRRGIWELLVKFRQGRTIILTTHFMDEADLLGDRIAIMSEGRLQCCGSGVFLKERLGSGYHLTVEWAPDKDAPDGGQRRALLLQEVLAAVPAARPGEAADANEAVFALPDRHDVPAITALLERLDARRDDLGIASYAVSDTALEEVFLRVAEQKSENSSIHSEVTVEDDAPDRELVVTPLQGWPLIAQQYAALARKRFHYVRRDPKALFTQLVLPAVFVLLALALSSSQQANHAAPEVQLSTDMFASPVVGFFEQRYDSGAQGDTGWVDRYAASLLRDGVGSRLVGGTERWTEATRSNPDFSCTNSAPGGSGAPIALPSGELYYNASGADVTDWLLATSVGCRRNRYGGASFGAKYPLAMDVDSVPDNIMIWFNNKRQAAAPAYQNAINNVILRASLPAGARARDYGIQTSSWPLPEAPAPEDGDKKKLDTYEMSIVLSSALTVIFAMSFVPASFVMFLVEERVNQAKHLQLVSGLRPYVYWLQSYTWDLVSFVGSEIFVILIFVAYQTPMYTSDDNLIALILLILLYGMSCTPLLYLCSWFFRIPTMAFLVLSTGNLFVGMVSTITVIIMKITNPDEVEYVEKALLILPQFCLGQGLMNMALNHIMNQFREIQGQPTVPTLSWEQTVRYMVAMAIMSLALAVLVFLVEQSTHWWHGWQQASLGSRDAAEQRDDAEEDVRREQQRVADGHANDGMLVLKRITKRYTRRGRPAVDGVSLGVERGQCFGLLGLNGAGKTTIFKMLTGDTLISSGDALVAGRSVRADMDSVRRLTGYCPQFDALVPLLTVREHLDLYSSLRGVPRHQRPAAVQRAVAMLDLGAHQHKQAKSLSGGNKRKLSAAIALVGDPELLYMDEPTTSMDPLARRFVWQRVRRVVAAGRSVVLTSHSMEECEALCARLTIMVNGRLTCIGSPHHLKHKYGSGYVAVVRCAAARMAEARALLLQRLPGASVVEAHWHQMKLQVPPQQPLVSIFRALDEAQRAGSVKNYSLSQTTLEDVFMRFARAQKTESS